MNAWLAARGAVRSWMLAATLAVGAALLASPRPIAAADDEKPMQITAKLVAASGDAPAKLEITAVIAPHYHTYSITQPKGAGPQPDVIKVEPSPQFTLGAFTASPEPKKEYDPNFKAEIETHYDRVVWSAPLTLAEGVSLEQVTASGEVKYFVCRESNCQMGKAKFTAALSGESANKPAPAPAPSESPTPLRTGLNLPGATFDFAPNSATPNVPAAPVAAAASNAPAAGETEYRGMNAKVAVKGMAYPSKVRPGDVVYVTLQATPDEHFHVYPLEANDDVVGYKPTLLTLSETGGFTPGATTSTKPAIEHDLPAGKLSYYTGPVAWTVRLDVPKDAAPGEHRIQGSIGMMACSDEGCDAPRGTQFTATITVGESQDVSPVLLAFTPAKYRDVSNLIKGGSFNAGRGPIAVAANAAETPAAVAPVQRSQPAPAVARAPVGEYQIKEVGGVALKGLPMILAAAFLGGFILNFMPCVLPVIGLKLMSFVSQAGENRVRVFFLNVAYSLGVLSVFMVLATLAAVFNYGWGEQFTNKWFTIGLASLIWVMSLSFLGVWELPIPGMSSGGAGNLARKEGYVGGFFKGVVATLLATPCSGPFVGSVLGATLTMPVSEIYLVFAAVGLGMASPYLVIGVFPKLVSFLPKPGAWMETFKQAMGFMLMGGVIFLVNSLPSDYFIPTFTFLIGLWAAVWWIGRTDPTADFSTTARAWMVAGTIVLLVSAASFGMLIPGKDLPWKPFTKEALAQYQAEGKTVLVDFTADWCTNCKAIEKFVLNTWWTSKVVDANGVITLKADMTEESEEIQSMLNSLGSTSIPVTAIFPADRPNEPLVIRDIYTSWTLLDALNEAGPSKNVAAPAAAPNGVAPATPASETALAPVPAEPGVMR